MTVRRAPVIVVLVTVLAAMAAADVGDVGGGGPSPFGTAGSFAMPVTDPAGSLSSTWFCPATGVEGDETVVVSNHGDEPRRGSLTWLAGEGAPVSEQVEVGPHEGVSLGVPEGVDGASASAVVELDGGGVAVARALRSGGASGVASCSSTASDRWYLANGATTRDATQLLTLFNPFPDDAIVDVAFATDQGRDEPEALRGLPVRARSTMVVNLGDVVRRRELTATEVTTRRGRLVVQRTQRFDGSAGRSGLSLALAAPAPAEAWTFPIGMYDEGIAERWHVYNPSDRDAMVSLEIVPDNGDIPVPVDRTVPARSQLVIDAGDVESLASGAGHSSSVRSLNEVPVVVERELSAGPPASRQGWSSAPGAPLVAAAWLLPAGDLPYTARDQVVVHNPGAEPVRVSIAVLDGGRVSPLEGLQDVEIAAAARQQVEVGDLVRRVPLPLLVQADGPVVVERELSPTDGPGIATLYGIPLG
jgi:hypothetical protein